MKTAHKALISKAAAARKAIDAETARIEKLQAEIDAGNEKLAGLRTDLSEIEHEAADSGLAVSDLHTAVKG